MQTDIQNTQTVTVRKTSRGVSRKQLDGLEVDDQLQVVYRPGLITFTKRV